MAANRRLRARAEGLGVELKVPPPELCTDNAAMIASAARWVEPLAFPGYLDLDAYASGGGAAPPSRARSSRRAAEPTESRADRAGRGRRAPGVRPARLAQTRPAARRERPALAAAAVAPRGRAAGGREPPPPPASPMRCPSTALAARAGGRGHARARRAAAAGARPAGIAAPARSARYVRSLEDEAGALRSALGRAACGSRRRRVRRVFNGFAATVRTRDLADLSSLGVRAQPVRRFYPASARPPACRGCGRRRRDAAGGAPVAVLDSGVDPRTAARRPAGSGLRRGRRDETRRRRAIRAEAGARRAARLWPASSSPRASACCRSASRACSRRRRRGAGGVAISDQLLAGIERAVDPDADGATDDHVPVALVGVNSPYAAFERSPEARAVRGAAALGTLVVAPAGGEAAAAGPQGTAARPPPRPTRSPSVRWRRRTRSRASTSRIGAADARGAVLLGGLPAARRDPTAGPVEATDPAELLARRRQPARQARGRPRGRRAGGARRGGRCRRRARGAAGGAAPPPAARDPRGPHRRPVLGVTGEVAEAVLDEEAGAAVEVGEVTPGRAPVATLRPRGEAAGESPSATRCRRSPAAARRPAAASCPGSPRPGPR